MLQVLSFAVALVGSSLAGIWDLNTTEVPDKIPYSMILIAVLLNSYLSLTTSNPWYIIKSLIVGISLFVFGFVLYYFGQWGGADAKLLSAVGFLLPNTPNISIFSGARMVFPFPVSYVSNLFLVGSIYMLVYALIVSLKDKKILRVFVKDVRASSKFFLFTSTVLFISLVSINWFFYNRYNLEYSPHQIIFNSFVPVVGTSILYIIWRFALVVENKGFKKRVTIKDLKPGDVLMKSKVWNGITNSDIEKLKKSGRKYVYVKSGVRFCPSFPLALLFTAYFGDAIFFFMRFL